ncbi:MAG: WD40 repeat domain-containing protein [Planctomycetota bacterium]|jgi:WD40 repeat protein
MLDSQHLAAVSKQGKKALTLYNLPSGEKQKDIAVGWEDQDVWPRVSPDKQTVALIRLNAPDSKNSILYEFLTLNVDTAQTGSPVPVSIQQDTEDFVDTALANDKILYAVGSQKDIGRIMAVDLEKSVALWESLFEDTKEFCSVTVSPDGSFLYAGNRDGYLYKISAATGEVLTKIQLLQDGETRPVTNDYSVLNLAYSPDGRYYVATITPRAYILTAESDKIIHAFSPADRLVSKIAFSPDSKFIATSDIRAGYPVKIWPLPEGSGQ